ncbi:SlyX family protein [Trichloromonas sp.]|uniref:SlyX family protein n=1 Tax=Trichloromonas sp. TaxID=3069249 RepID=UPI003D81B056
MDELNQRIDELEIRYTHQEQVIDELNGVVAECNLRIARLERDVNSYREMLQSLAPGLPESPDE